MHGTVRTLHQPIPSVSGLNSSWRPTLLSDLEKVLGNADGWRGKTHAEIAASLGIPTAEFSNWLVKFRGAMHARPGALPSLQHLLDLRKSGGRYPCIQPSDVPRRADALARAEALSASMPIWPGALEPVEWKQESYPCGYSKNNGGWEKDEDGVAKREKRINGTKLYRKAVRADDDESEDLEHAMEEQPMKPRLVNDKPEPGAFPKTLAAAQKREVDAWALGDALVEEAGKPCASGKRGGGSYARIAEAQKHLAAHGIDLSFISLRFMRDTAFAFKPVERRLHSFAVYQAARSPETLAAVIASQPGTPVTVRHVRAFLQSAKEPSPGKDDAKDHDAEPGNVAYLVAPLVKALLLQGKAMRVSTIAGLMDALGLSPSDLAPAATPCQRRAARCLTSAPAQVEGRGFAA